MKIQEVPDHISKEKCQLIKQKLTEKYEDVFNPEILKPMKCQPVHILRKEETKKGDGEQMRDILYSFTDLDVVIFEFWLVYQNKKYLKYSIFDHHTRSLYIMFRLFSKPLLFSFLFWYPVQ